MASKSGVYFMTQPGLLDAAPDRVWPQQRFATLFIEVDPRFDITNVMTPLFTALQDRSESSLRWAVTSLRFENRLQQELAQRRLEAGELFGPPPLGLGKLVVDSESVTEIRSTTAQVRAPLTSGVLADLAVPDALVVFTPTETTASELASSLRAFACEAQDEGGLSNDLIRAILYAHPDWVVLRLGGQEDSYWNVQIAGAKRWVHDLANALQGRGFPRYTNPLDFIEAAGAGS